MLFNKKPHKKNMNLMDGLMLKHFAKLKFSLLTMAALLVSMPVISTATANPGLMGKSLTKAKPITDSQKQKAKNYFTDTVLTTQSGEKLRFYSDVLDGHVVMLNVIYTSCQGACPMLTQKLSEVSKQLGDQFGNNIRFVSVSNDPERDTPEALAKFAAKQNVNMAGWTFLTGPKDEVDGIITKLGLYTSNFQEHKSTILIGNTRTGHWKKLQPNLPHQGIAL